MEKLEKYRQLVQEFLLEYSKNKPAYGEIEVQPIFDTVRDHYQIVYLGWENDHLIHSCPIHIDIKGEKIWLQWNGTEIDIAEELVTNGVAKKDIVLGFHTPFMRKFTEYSVG
ncbi:MAG: XisI protein [Okeania sp. SIO3I5]|uniref:XisI protein n=1 Tax=Okeania sp. SIO3I5 TaxID=2607805 RepID=UPI0013BE2CE8|nr:XisI protein [Okeania sp. SIO3I5]NEQ38562.1 XisI protein [Okeania sp. SIO3I5]